MTGGAALGLFAHLPGRLRGHLIKQRHPVANRLQAAAPLGSPMQSPKRGPNGSVQSVVVHLYNVGATWHDSTPVPSLFISQKVGLSRAGCSGKLRSQREKVHRPVTKGS